MIGQNPHLFNFEEYNFSVGFFFFFFFLKESQNKSFSVVVDLEHNFCFGRKEGTLDHPNSVQN